MKAKFTRMETVQIRIAVTWSSGWQTQLIASDNIDTEETRAPPIPKEIHVLTPDHRSQHFIAGRKHSCSRNYIQIKQRGKNPSLLMESLQQSRSLLSVELTQLCGLMRQRILCRVSWMQSRSFFQHSY